MTLFLRCCNHFQEHREPEQDPDDAVLATPAPQNIPAIVRSASQCAVTVRGFVKAFPPKHLLLAVLASKDDRNLGALQTSATKKVEFLCPEECQRLLHMMDGGDLRVPDKKAILRGRMQLDWACMAWARDANHSPGTVWRQLNVDASPQGGVEIFGVREVVIREADVDKHFSHRTLPLQSLGFQHAAAVDKMNALASALYLEAGPRLEDIQCYCSTVFSLVTDLGVELCLADMPDFLEVFVRGAEALDGFQKDTYMFPNCMKVPDLSHMWSWQIQEVCSSLSFWKAYLPLSKAICKLLTTVSYVDALVNALEPAERELHERPLRAFHAKFAKWRYETLHTVSADLQKVREALPCAWGAARLQLRDSDTTSKVNQAVSSSTFWLENDVIYCFASFCEQLRQWSLGCSCHELELQRRPKGQVLHCPRKSMRAVELYDHLRVMKTELRASVNALLTRADIAEHPLLREAARMGGYTLLANIGLKFQFLDTMPYLLWRLRRDNSLALRILQEFDTYIMQEQQGIPCSIHRLTVKFAHPQGILRRSLEEHYVAWQLAVEST